MSLLGHLQVSHAAVAMAVLVAVTLLAGGISAARAFAPPQAATLAVALALRLLVVLLAYHHTPHDVAVDFLHTGQAVLHGENPLLSLPQYRWNFLPTMPYVHALEIQSGMPWPVAGKICPVLADLTSIGLFVSGHHIEQGGFPRAVGTDQPGNRAWLYADRASS